MLIEIFKDHNLKMSALIGKEFAAATIKRYETSLRHTEAFLNDQYGLSDIDIRKIDHEFISEYDFYLRAVRNAQIILRLSTSETLVKLSVSVWQTVGF